mmetsp:Transcript_26019/g.49508  ORF Transcript_26019/g.49508 Transcript_26019/m.49508 type:complete len:87 (-) Transcript_26019:122-382(-)
MSSTNNTKCTSRHGRSDAGSMAPIFSAVHKSYFSNNSDSTSITDGRQDKRYDSDKMLQLPLGIRFALEQSTISIASHHKRRKSIKT